MAETTPAPRHAYAVYDPNIDNVYLDTVRSSRAEAVNAYAGAGAARARPWSFYRRTYGLRTVRITITVETNDAR